MRVSNLGAPKTLQEPSRESRAASGASRLWHMALESATNLLNAIGSVAILVLMCLMLLDLGSRWLLGKPIAGVAEIAGLSIVAIVYLQLGAAVRSGRMMRADFLAGLLNKRAPRLGCLLGAIFQCLGAITMAMLAYVSMEPFISAWRDGETLGTAGVFQVSTWPFRGVLLLGTSLATMCYLTLALSQLARLVRVGDRSD
ncbi:TRAP transporter small permease [uncultured Hydrogenophaga sp.]|uniref:TRAP transporter small permease subunit n=1 Tax=uncultured Hydrogenophaga sp. TaxID=199683 RepID=UPI00258C8DA8|nr:TRAP transporter small permease [uncultured Hydrogenophaga sp.]